MVVSLLLAAFVLGLAGVPHCAAMCGSACALAFPRGVPAWSLLGRCLGYALLGGIVAGSVGVLGQWGRGVAFLKPFWVLAQSAAFLLAVYMLARGRMPDLMDDLGRKFYFWVRASLGLRHGSQVDLGVRPMLAMLAGMAWALLPCGLLYAALTIAALAPHAWSGALVMLAFSLPGALGVWAAPSLLRWLVTWSGRVAGPARAPSSVASAAGVAPVVWIQRNPARPAEPDAEPLPGGAAGIPGFDPAWAIRASGAMLLGMTTWALYHQILDQWRAWCA